MWTKTLSDPQNYLDKLRPVHLMCLTCIFHCSVKYTAQRDVSGNEGLSGQRESKHCRSGKINKSAMKRMDAMASSATPKGSEKPQKTTKVHDDRIISMAKKNSFTTFNRVFNAFEGVGVSSSRSKINSRLCEWKQQGVNRWFHLTTRRPDSELRIRACTVLKKEIFGQMKPRWTCTKEKEGNS